MAKARMLLMLAVAATALAGIFVLYATVLVAESEPNETLPADSEAAEFVEHPQLPGVHAVGLAGRDALSLDTLLAHCTNKEDIVMLSPYAASVGDKAKKLYLETCYPFEINYGSDNPGARSLGHCMDLVLYVFYAGARLSPVYDKATLEQKLEKCPKSTYLHTEENMIPYFFKQHAIVRNFMMPNLEWMGLHGNYTETTLVQTHTVLCKTRVCHKYVEQFVKENLGNSTNRGPRVLYVAHSSNDKLAGTSFNHVRTQDFNTFFHSYGYSTAKSTPQILECWMQHPEWPKLVVIGNRPDFVKITKQIEARENIELKSRIEPNEMKQLQLSNGVHLCPSTAEGYGHYINEARSLGALLVTTDFPPMNEFAKDDFSGVLVEPTDPFHLDWQTFGAKNRPTQAHVRPNEICTAVERVIKMSKQQKQTMGMRARKGYVEDSEFNRKYLSILFAEACGYLWGGEHTSLTEAECLGRLQHLSNL
ncbi:hypothetical protein CcCBS67573_g05596 [Chytriomyces confervae]|uniref:Glycosyl transferase family 1 domain-containing protein n=1 Tax=Chytriomyces confervae TaxID=246404 RepID=A0A507FBL8_9FUNG|nr:hypothetical protein HDU80_009671 [Chytriomyces hyalinus]TPX73135.1 hypothetical protein CcCBS67573_g05596 [Chytriomyces confervae]